MLFTFNYVFVQPLRLNVDFSLDADKVSENDAVFFPFFCEHNFETNNKHLNIFCFKKLGYHTIY